MHTTPCVQCPTAQHSSPALALPTASSLMLPGPWVMGGDKDVSFRLKYSQPLVLISFPSYGSPRSLMPTAEPGPYDVIHFP